MPEIPLILKLRKQSYKDIAAAQDIIVKELYNILDKAVFHGGTAIWRCYGGNRFSEDIDVYIPKNEENINAFFERMKNKGFIVKKKKISENSLYSELELNRTSVRFEALFIKKMPEAVLGEYLASDGNMITVYVLSPEKLVKEKVNAYLKRLKIRDLYDIFFLLRHVKDKEVISKDIRNLINNFKDPVDEKDLKILIIEGLVPSTEKMIQYISENGQGKIS